VKDYKTPGDKGSDWKAIVRDMTDYTYVCSVADEYLPDRRKWERIIKRFDEKRTEWLKREGFRDLLSRDDDASYSPRDDSIYSTNPYLTVYVKNFGTSDFRENQQRYLYTDYYEERP